MTEYNHVRPARKRAKYLSKKYGPHFVIMNDKEKFEVVSEMKPGHLFVCKFEKGERYDSIPDPQSVPDQVRNCPVN